MADGRTPTAEFPLLSFPFPEFNPVQSEALPFMVQDVNIVVAAPTSAGKTVIAELAIAQALAEPDRSAIFLSPLKAVTQEKFDDWQRERFSDRRISIVTGDYTLTTERRAELAAAEIILLTSEMLDSRTRRMKQEQNEWLYKVRALVCDEAHLLTVPDRGHSLESGVMRFSEQNPEARLVLLSATMPNVDELGKWLTNLNGKPSTVLRSSWRPVPHETHYLPHKSKCSYGESEGDKMRQVLALVCDDYPDDRWLVFVHTKNAGRKILAALKERKVEAEFHSADLDRDERLRVEAAFRER